MRNRNRVQKNKPDDDAVEEGWSEAGGRSGQLGKGALIVRLSAIRCGKVACWIEDQKTDKRRGVEPTAIWTTS